MAIFGRHTARQRLQRAARESLKVPAFSSPVDCAPWVTGGLWPAELSTVTTETAPLVTYLKTDLQRIVNSANDELKEIRRSGLADPARQAEEARIINDARAFAVRRVESTVRHLRDMTVKPSAPSRPAAHAETAAHTRRFTLNPPRPEPEEHTEPQEHPEPDDHTDVFPAVDPQPVQPKHARPEPVEPEPVQPEPVAPEAVEPVADPESATVVSMFDAPLGAPPSVDEPVADDAETASQPVPEPASESDPDRLKRVLTFVARQEPGLRWAVGIRLDGTIVLATDLAHGWIPPGVTLPAEIQLLEPARRKGTATALLGPTSISAKYAPGDPLGWAGDHEATDTSPQPRDLPPIEDLGWLLGEATHWRDGLPRMVNTLARAGAAGTGVVDAEIDILRVYLDTARYQLLAQYPDIDTGLLLNCLLLAATDGIAAGDQRAANYHFAWFQVLSAPAASGWKAGP